MLEAHLSLTFSFELYLAAFYRLKEAAQRDEHLSMRALQHNAAHENDDGSRPSSALSLASSASMRPGSAQSAMSLGSMLELGASRGAASEAFEEQPSSAVEQAECFSPLATQV